MKSTCSESLLTIPRFDQIPFLIHGFGTAAWTEDCIKSDPAFEGFRWVIMRQTHSDIIHTIEDVPIKVLEGDALITASTRIGLVVKTADCLPVFLVSESWGVVAAVHCGWKGTGKHIIQKTIMKLEDDLGCQPSSLLAAMGPCIGPDCYEVGEDVLRFFNESGLSLNVFRKHPERPDKHFLDLKKANRQQMLEAGVSEEKIFFTGNCTHCDTNLLSYRRDRDVSGHMYKRMYNFIGIKQT